MLECLQEFIKYNAKLIHLDLTSCALIEPAIKYICKILTRAQSLRAIHLCANSGLGLSTFDPDTEKASDMVNWIRNRIKAKSEMPYHNIANFD
jgi:hypothetical protein